MLHSARASFAPVAAVVFCLGLAAAARADQVPFTASFSGTFAITPPPACAPAAAKANLQGGGQATLLGAATTAEVICFDPNTLAASSTSFTFTGASGTLTGTFGGALTPTGNPLVFSVNVPFTITGGTGLFAGATGGGTKTGQITFTQDFSGGSFSFTYAGSVTAPAPEPATLVLLGTGLAGAVGVVRTRRRTGEA